jgi:hypothetical protein
VTNNQFRAARHHAASNHVLCPNHASQNTFACRQATSCGSLQQQTVTNTHSTAFERLH